MADLQAFVVTSPDAARTYSVIEHHEDIMGSDIMVRILKAQVAAIYPFEKRIIDSYVTTGKIPADARVLSIGCGTGEFERRLLDDFKGFNITGIDVEEGHLETAQRACSKYGARASFMMGNALALPEEWTGQFDLVLNRHMIHLFTAADVEVLVREMARVVRSKGMVHILPEDYGMLFFDGTSLSSMFYFTVLDTSQEI
jgi:ubiquinone/menaquinone biosynthesis C-methylase UbiE